jgi:microcystin-dependent protein
MEPMIGQIALFAGNFAPKGWAFCDGSLVRISHNNLLFAVLGTTYGGDGRTDFALPDLRSHAPVSGSNYIIAVQGNFPLRE